MNALQFYLIRTLPVVLISVTIFYTQLGFSLCNFALFELYILFVTDYLSILYHRYAFFKELYEK